MPATLAGALVVLGTVVTQLPAFLPVVPGLLALAVAVERRKRRPL